MTNGGNPSVMTNKLADNALVNRLIWNRDDRRLPSHNHTSAAPSGPRCASQPGEMTMIDLATLDDLAADAAALAELAKALQAKIGAIRQAADADDASEGDGTDEKQDTPSRLHFG